MHISAYEPCLERVAEELMGRRKWKQYQESLMRTHLNSDQFVASIEDNNIEQKKPLDNFYSKNGEFIDLLPQAAAVATLADNSNLEENHRKDSRNIPQKEQQQKEKATEDEQVKDTTLHHIKLEADTFKDKTASQIANNTASLQIANNNNNNITITLNNNNNNNNNTTLNTIGTTNEAKSHFETPQTPPPPEPIDWKPNEKCNFCINGKLLTVNAKGELVAESGPTGSETDHIQKLDCESDSNESISNAAVSTASVNTNGNLPLMSGAATLTDSNPTTLNKLLTQKMASMDSVAAQLAAIQSILPNLNWMSQQQQQQQQQQQSQPDSVIPTTSDTLAAAISPSLKDSPSPSDATGEQPLDLSSKPSPNSSISGDLKSIRIKSSRATPVPSTRRDYSEEDLNCALQDILSGKLGTRKAAVQYNVPRSTLRNKIYKLTAEAKRNNEPAPPELLQLQQELEKEMSGDENDVESNASTPQPEDAIVRLIPTPNILKKLCTNNGDGTEVGCDAEEHVLLHRSPKPAHIESSKPQTCESTAVSDLTTTQAPQVPALDAALPLLLRTLLLSDKGIRDLFSALLSSNLKDLLLGPSSSAATTSSAATLSSSESLNSNLNNGNQQQQDYRSLLQLLLQQQQQQQQHQQQHQPTSYATGRRLPKSDTPETNSSVDPNEACDDPAAILKIPSYTPVAGPSNSLGASSSRASPALLCHSNSNSNSNRNGNSPDQLLLAAAVQKQFSSKNLSVTPPLMHTRVDGSPSPQTMRISDVIASSIQRTMNEQANKEAASLLNFTAAAEAERNHALALGNDYKKPTISVVKNIGGTDTSRFGAAPNLLAGSQHHHHSAHLQHSHHHHLSRQEAAALAAGKGTRPKRGKYRNYDRDSLVEAVKAVQRGEMSVHRAGSYYGVPHSTLEYKVKERHLMRPRKREPKPQPGLDGSSSSSKTNANIPGNLSAKALNSANNNLKLTSGAGIKSNNGSGTNAATFASNNANGMKLSIFEPNLQHLPYSPQLFWSHNQAAFGQLQMDFNRNTTAPSAASPTDNSSDILKNHMQRYQDSNTNSSNGPSPVSSPVLSGQDINRARELYESKAANGASFLDGIIRKSLDRKTNEVNATSTSASSGGGVLLDQLLMKKTPLPFTNNRNNEFNTSISPSPMAGLKRCGSPLSLGSSSTIKRERCSPHSGDSDDDETSQSGLDESYENNNNNNNSKTGNGQGLKTLGISQTRSRVASRDSNSETDNSSMKSEIHMSNHHPHHPHHHSATGHPNNINNLLDINGGGGSGSSGVGGVTVKTEIPNHETTSTSILQEKLSQIKAEQQENEENL